MATKRKNITPNRYPQWEFPGLHVERLTGHGMYAGSFVVTWNPNGKMQGSTSIQTDVVHDQDIEATNADGESRLDLYPLILRTIQYAMGRTDDAIVLA